MNDEAQLRGVLVGELYENWRTAVNRWAQGITVYLAIAAFSLNAFFAADATPWFRAFVILANLLVSAANIAYSWWVASFLTETRDQAERLLAGTGFHFALPEAKWGRRGARLITNLTLVAIAGWLALIILVVA